MTTLVAPRTGLVIALAVFLTGCLSSEEQTDVPDTTDTTPPPDQSNASPVISGTPDAAVASGDVYTFSPSASDPDGDTLTFSIRNKPAWLDFDDTSGELSGQAFLGNVGVYDDIQISVSDGTTESSLPSFSVTVTDAGVGAMTLSWTPPTENTDGSTLTDLAGYNIYYGKSSGSYSNTVRIDNPSISTYMVENLVPDTYYVVATSFNAAGIESAYSNEAVKTVSSN